MTSLSRYKSICHSSLLRFFFFNDTATTEIYTLSLHDALPISSPQVIPSSQLIDFTLQLPLGSEARGYSVMLSSKRHVVWSDSAQAHLKDGQMFLRMHADFTHVRV